MDQTRTYAVVLQPEPEGGFTVRVPALPEIVTYGENEVEALAMAKEAIELAMGTGRLGASSTPNYTSASNGLAAHANARHSSAKAATLVEPVLHVRSKAA